MVQCSPLREATLSAYRATARFGAYHRAAYGGYYATKRYTQRAAYLSPERLRPFRSGSMFSQASKGLRCKALENAVRLLYHHLGKIAAPPIYRIGGAAIFSTRLWSGRPGRSGRRRRGRRWTRRLRLGRREGRTRRPGRRRRGRRWSWRLWPRTAEGKTGKQTTKAPAGQFHGKAPFCMLQEDGPGSTGGTRPSTTSICALSIPVPADRKLPVRRSGRGGRLFFISQSAVGGGFQIGIDEAVDFPIHHRLNVAHFKTGAVIFGQGVRHEHI